VAQDRFLGQVFHRFGMVPLADMPQEAIAREHLASTRRQRLLFDGVLVLEPDGRDHGEPDVSTMPLWIAQQQHKHDVPRIPVR
jgi:hypothetical protein